MNGTLTVGHWPRHPRTHVCRQGTGGTGQDSGCMRMHLTQLRAAPVLAWLQAPAGILGAVTEPQSHLVWYKPLSRPACPTPRKQLPYKKADSSVPLTGRVESGGDHGRHQCPAVGKDMGLGSLHLSRMRSACNFFRGPKIGFLEQKRAVLWFSHEVVRKRVREQEGN